MSRSMLDVPNDYQYYRTKLYVPREKHFCFRHSSYLLPVIIIIILVLIVLFYPTKSGKVNSPQPIEGTKVAQCDIQLVETLPAALNYTADDSTRCLSTFEAWKWLLDNAKTNFDISSLYWHMQSAKSNLSHGDYLYQRFLDYRLMKPKLKLRIAEHKFYGRPANDETLHFLKLKAADVVYINFQKYFGGSGLLHTKLWIVDNQHFYLGSADMDWRSLIQTKELGILAKGCPHLAMDVRKIFETYWFLGTNPNKKLPDQWPQEYNTPYNKANPILLNFNSKYTGNAYFSSSPPPLSANGRTHDLDAILNAIDNANSYINIAVMDYYPLIIYTKRIKYWPYIDDALRRAVVDRNVSVKLLISKWKYSNPLEDYFLHSLQDLSHMLSFVDLEVRRFVVPEGAVNHNKYLVTEHIAYIGTSNWSGDFLTNSAGIGLVLNDTRTNQPQNVTTLRTDLLKVFKRDWESPYALLLRRHDKL